MENLICRPYPEDRWWTQNEYNDPGISEDILLHEFAHGIQHVSLEAIDPLYIHRLDITYRKAMKEGLWNNTYAATNRNEYFAIGSQAQGFTQRRLVERSFEVGPRFSVLPENACE